MKKAHFAIVLGTVSVIVTFCLFRAWQAREVPKNGESEHYLFIDSPKEWGFYTIRAQTLVAYFGGPDCNTIHEQRQIGPVCIVREYEPDACVKSRGKH